MDDLDFDEFRKQVKDKFAGEFKRTVRTIDDLRNLKRGEVDVLEPDEVELAYETTENVPSKEDAENDEFWKFRVRTDLPKKYCNRATVVVSIVFRMHVVEFGRISIG